MKVRLDIKGFDALQKKLGAKAFLSKIDDQMTETAQEIYKNSKTKAESIAKTADGGSIPLGGALQSAAYIKIEYLHKIVGYKPFDLGNGLKSWPAFIEFGTGNHVEIPSGLEGYARIFYINGRGTILPAPFIFPAQEAAMINFFRRIKTLL